MNGNFGYTPPEQIVKDRADFARKGVAKGRSVVVASYQDGILLFADNPSMALRKISEMIDGIAFAAAGKYSEYEGLRIAGLLHVDHLAYAFSRSDITARSLANEYARGLGAVVGEGFKPLEIELLLVECGPSAAEDVFFRIGFDGTVAEESGVSVVGGGAEVIAAALTGWDKSIDLRTAFQKISAVLNHPTLIEAAIVPRGSGRRFSRLSAETQATLSNS